MRILHTADWHLGARLVERDRLPEHAVFLDWLIDTLRSERIDALLVSGDIFDAASPPQDAVALYFDFIKRLADLKTVRTVITGGNHDSATHLNAPRALLRRFDVHVLGHAASCAEAALDLGGAVVGAVPFLRERDLRRSAAAETATDAQTLVRSAIRSHYSAQLEACRAIAHARPVIAMGHLTVLGAAASDSERDIHIGNLGAISADVFAGFDYTALGHLHRPQNVAGFDAIRYSGSPIPLSFSEAGDAKSVVLIEIPNGRTAEPATTRSSKSNGDSPQRSSLCGVRLLPVPTTRLLIRATANRAMLAADLGAVPTGCWAEITVKLDAPEPDLDRHVREAAGSRFEVLKVLVDLPAAQEPAWRHAGPALNELQPRDVFRELLKERQIEDAELVATFDQLLRARETKTHM
ncbi:MAG: exonuclease SbcCD subunit D C-terminal domain-containing protein [Verrucomicrobiaceae bacterium]|nr:exonuclease SbcCD subunit D C-terminal domain-containing protein [Verrucomicrobiaceae bacterium]